jgi:hypothetical protein
LVLLLLLLLCCFVAVRCPSSVVRAVLCVPFVCRSVSWSGNGEGKERGRGRGGEGIGRLGLWGSWSPRKEAGHKAATGEPKQR